METSTSIANAMSIAQAAATLDENVVKIFSHKSVLSILMKYTVREFEGLTAEFIEENCFLNDPIVRKMAVDQDVPDMEEIPELFRGLDEEPEEDAGDLREPDDTVGYDALLDGNTLIEGLNSVDKTQREGTVIYDIIFMAKVPETNDVIELIINVEIQNDLKIDYEVVTRGLYYCARMISAQKNRTFRKSEYGKIKKVYSIWICPYSKKKENTVTTYDIRENRLYGEADVPKAAYNKLETIVITLNKEGLKSENELIRYLSLLTNRETPVEERQATLEKDYRLQMTERIKEEVGSMCNYSDAVFSEGVQKGIARGIVQGISQGEDNVVKLYQVLSGAGRMDDYIRSMNDTKYREQLFHELGIKEQIIPVQ